MGISFIMKREPPKFEFAVEPASPFELPLVSNGTYDFTVDWGDGSEPDDINTWDDSAKNHNYAGSGPYTITITGQIEGWQFDNNVYAPAMRTVSKWGPLKLGNNGSYFYGCDAMTVTATDVLDTSGITNMANAFRNCVSMVTVPSMNSWDMSSVTDMSYMLGGYLVHHQYFNQDISNWDTSNVTNMQEMFFNARDFNQNIGGWNVEKVESIYRMFWYCYAFNQPIGAWTTSALTTVASAFQGSGFNQPLDNWDMSNVEDTTSMFNSALAFNQDLNSWDVSNVTIMASMFSGCDEFDGNITGWDVSNVTEFRSMFYGTLAFNQPIGTWTTTSVENLRSMFENSVFDQDISGWDVTNVDDCLYMFDGGVLSTANYDALLIGWEGQSVLNGVNADFGSTQYSAGAAATARSALVNSHSWNIDDGGQA